jgi:type I restriction enzyme S subunit
MSSVPTGWASDRLKDVAAINAVALSAATDPDYEFDYLEISNVEYHGIVDPNAIERLRFEDAPSRARRRVAAGSTVISSVRPNLQAVAFFPDTPAHFVCSTGFNVVEPQPSRLSPQFAYYHLISENARQYFEAAATGVGYPAVGDKEFNAIAVPLPPVAEQQRIAAYLDASCAAIDAAVAAKRRQLETLDALRKAIIERAVTYGIAAHPKLRQVDNEWLKEVPAHWEVCRIKRVLTRMDYGISVSTIEEGRYPVLKMGHLQDGEIRFSNLDFVDEVDDNLILETGDLLYNRTNSPDQVGKAAVFRKSRTDAITFASYLVRLRVNHRANAWFLNYVFNSDGFLGFARRLAIPSVQQSNLNSTRYSRMFIPLPPVREQETIRAYLDEKTGEVNRIVADIESQIATLTAYRKSLIHECVTGQRRVTEEDVRRAGCAGSIRPVERRP